VARSAWIGLQVLTKRGLDVGVSLIGLFLGLPLLMLVGALVRLDSHGPIIYSQVRTGRGGREFVIRKFRTMRWGAELRTNPDGSARVEAGDERVTRFGKLLREFGLDELPQLWNVLRGEMSLVGPRPYMPRHTSILPAWARRRIEMRPGLVCLAEVSGRNALPWERRLELDVYYVDNWSLWLDAVILVRAIPVVAFRRGVYTAPPDPTVCNEADALGSPATRGRESE
jgi:undecaprenyl-phosphate galactose phosphotransferase